MNYYDAARIRKKGFANLMADKLASGQGIVSSLRGTLSDRSKAKSMAFKERFDPMNIAKFLTGGSNLAPAIVGRLTGRSREDIGYFTGKRQYQYTPRTGNYWEKYSNPNMGGGSRKATQVLEKIVSFMQKSREDDVKEQETLDSYNELNEYMKADNHKEVVDVFKEAIKNKRKAMKAMAKEAKKRQTQKKPKEELPTVPPVKPSVPSPTAPPAPTVPPVKPSVPSPTAPPASTVPPVKPSVPSPTAPPASTVPPVKPPATSTPAPSAPGPKPAGPTPKTEPTASPAPSVPQTRPPLQKTTGPQDATATKIAQGESGGRHSIVYGGASQINGKPVVENTIQQIIEWQKKMQPLNKQAAGKYQFMDVAPLASKAKISLNEPFSAENQEKMYVVYREANANALKSVGLEVNPFNEMGAHSVGPGGLRQLINSDPNMIAAEVLFSRFSKEKKEAAIKTNPHLNIPIYKVFERWSKKVGHPAPTSSFVAQQGPQVGGVVSEMSKENADMKKNMSHSTQSVAPIVIQNSNTNKQKNVSVTQQPLQELNPRMRR